MGVVNTANADLAVMACHNLSSIGNMLKLFIHSFGLASIFA